MQIRKATPADAHAIAAIAESVRYQPHSADPTRGYLVFVGTPDEYAARLEGNNTSYVAEREGQVVAFLLTSFSSEDTATHTEGAEVMERIFGHGSLLVDQIGVGSAARGLGAAQQLHQQMLSDVAPERMTACIMHWPLRNQRSIGFFEGKSGYRCIGEYHEGNGFLWGIYERATASSLVDARYPVGRFLYTGLANEPDFQSRIDRLAALPQLLRAAVAKLSESTLDLAPRPGAWTARQLVHHLADGNQVMAERVRLILTEDRPLVKTFDENTWAELEDARLAPVEDSLRILDGVHARLARLLRSTPISLLEREMMHPEQGLVKLDRLLSYLDWHGRHHTAQILSMAP
jgi:predicted GNAT superfamily acetyltransferase/uncharacterized damage-inducible protein DinB